MAEVQDAGDKKQVGKAKKRGKQDRLKEVEGLNDIMKTYNGREFVWRLLSECGLTSQAPFGDSGLMNRFEGKRDIGIWMVLEMNDLPADWYPQMQSEAMARTRGEN